MTSVRPPAANLLLEWVYGYRSHQCRNNAIYNVQGDIVYFVAGVCIVYSVKNQKQSFFLGHDDDIVSLSLHPDNITAVSGQVGKIPKICIWDTQTCQIKSILNANHQHGVGILSFNRTGNLLVSVGLDPQGTMTIWDWKKGKIMATTRGHNDRIFDCQFCPDNDTSLVSCGVKHIKFWTLSGNALSSKKGIFGKIGEIQSMFSVVFGPANTTYSSTASGDIYIWNENRLERVISKVHTGAVFALNASEDGYISGGKDGCVKLYDTQFQPISAINLTESVVGYPGLTIRSVMWRRSTILVGTQNGEIIEIDVRDRDKPQIVVEGHAEGEMWALAAHPRKPMFATASDDQVLRVWHSIERECIGKIKLDQKLRSCGFNEDGTLIACGCMDGSFVVIRLKDFVEVFRTKERKEVIHELKFSPDGKYLAIGSNDNFVDIYDVVQKYKKVGECRGNSSFITHLDWSEDSLYIQTNSGAAERLIFKAPAGKQVTKTEEIDAIKWKSWTGVLGELVNGIWEKYTDTNDVNALDVNFNHEVVATGDDFGLVKLFKFPTTKKGAHFRKYVGHSAHVTNVRWLPDQTTLVSIGGSDHAIFQWKLLPEGVSPETLDGQDTAYTDSCSEISDTDSSNAGELDSDVEKEKQTTYDRLLTKEDLGKLKAQIKEEMPADQKRKKAPSQGLRLEFVHGYRSYDCHNNLFYTNAEEITPV